MVEKDIKTADNEYIGMWVAGLGWKTTQCKKSRALRPLSKNLICHLSIKDHKDEDSEDMFY